MRVLLTSRVSSTGAFKTELLPRVNRIGAGFAGSDGSPANMDSWFAVTGGVVSGIVVDTRTANITGSTATANIYFGTEGVGATTQSTIVQLAQQF